MSQPVDALAVLADQLADAIADRLADRLAPVEASTPASPWLGVEQAAAYLGDAPTSRIYDLVQQHKLTPRRDGRRLLLRRGDLDGYVEGSS